MVCGKCMKDVSNASESVKCNKCKLDFHVICSSIGTVSKLEEMSVKAVSKWCCEKCGGCDYTESSVRDLLLDIRRDMTKSANENRQNFAVLEKSIVAVNETVANFQLKVKALEEDNAALKEKCDELYGENTRLSRAVRDLQYDMDVMQQYSRNHNIEIKGIPVSKGEDVYNILGAVSRALGVDSGRGDISIAHRLQKKKKDQHPSIVVQFVSRTTRANWLAAARKKRLNTMDLSPQLPQAPVYVNEHLTGLNKALLGRAKAYVREKKLAQVWSRDGKIMVKQKEDSAPTRVWTLDEVDNAAGVKPISHQEES